MNSFIGKSIAYNFGMVFVCFAVEELTRKGAVFQFNADVLVESWFWEENYALKWYETKLFIYFTELTSFK